MTTEQRRKSFLRNNVSAEEWIEQLKLHSKGTGQFGQEYESETGRKVWEFCCLGVAAKAFGNPDNCQWSRGDLRFGLSGYEMFSDNYEGAEFLEMLGWQDVKVERQMLYNEDDSPDPEARWSDTTPVHLLVHVNDSDNFDTSDWFPVIQTIRYIDMVAKGKLGFINFKNVPFRIFREENRRSTPESRTINSTITD